MYDGVFFLLFFSSSDHHQQLPVCVLHYYYYYYYYCSTSYTAAASDAAAGGGRYRVVGLFFLRTTNQFTIGNIWLAGLKYFGVCPLVVYILNLWSRWISRRVDQLSDFPRGGSGVVGSSPIT